MGDEGVDGQVRCWAHVPSARVATGALSLRRLRRLPPRRARARRLSGSCVRRLPAAASLSFPLLSATVSRPLLLPPPQRRVGPRGHRRDGACCSPRIVAPVCHARLDAQYLHLDTRWPSSGPAVRTSLAPACPHQPPPGDSGRRPAASCPRRLLLRPASRAARAPASPLSRAHTVGWLSASFSCIPRCVAQNINSRVFPRKYKCEIRWCE